jgi:hypothetical protein
VKVNYFPDPLDPSLTYPLIPIKIKGPTGTIELRCLVDSGAGFDSFPLSVAKEIGVPIESCTSDFVTGIGGRVPCYISEVEIRIGPCSYQTEAQFLPPVQMTSQEGPVFREIPPLLGRKATFVNFKIIFDEANRELANSTTM